MFLALMAYCHSIIYSKNWLLDQHNDNVLNVVWRTRKFYSAEFGYLFSIKGSAFWWGY